MNAGANLKELVSEKNLKLSVLEPDAANQGGLLALNQGGVANVKYQVFVQPCNNPRCGCCDVLFQCRADFAEGKVATPNGSREFWLDVRAQKAVVTVELKKEPESMRLAENLAAALTSSDWERLYQWHRVSKLEIIERATSSEIDVRDLPDATGGRMVPFIEVFPFGLALYFPMQDEIWAADEMYCVQPNCDCKETVLSFLRLQDAAGAKTTSASDPPAIRYNHGTRSAGEAFPGKGECPEPPALLAALKKTYPLLNQMLERRHLLMQNIYLRHHLERLSQVAPATVRRKVGRNEQCPCGSGKKFKHCCLGISQKQ